MDFLFKGLNRTQVFGGAYIPQRGERNLLILCNHISALDPLLIGATAMPRFSPVWWRAAAKEELFQHPVSRWAVRSIGALPVKRGQRDQASRARLVQSLKTDVLVIFPEGTWSTTGEVLPGRLGVGQVVYEARPSKILPVAVWGTDSVLPRGAFIPRFGRKLRIAYGAPLELDAFWEMEDGPETYEAIVAVFMGEIKKLWKLLTRVDDLENPGSKSINQGT